MLLTLQQTNYLFERITDCGQDPADFRLITHSYQIDLVHPASKSGCSIWRADPERVGVYHAKMTVGGAETHFIDAGSFAIILSQLGTWLADVEYQSTAPDKWAELRQVRNVLAAAQAPDASNAPFTAAEQGEIALRIDEVKQFVATSVTLDGQRRFAAIEQALDQIKEASTRVGRKDLAMMINGAMFSLIVNDLVPAHVVQLIFNVLITGIGHLFGFGGPPPVIST